MKKTKLLTPILTGLTVTSAVAPLTTLTSCGQTEKEGDLFTYSGTDGEKSYTVPMTKCSGTVYYDFTTSKELTEDIQKSITVTIYVNESDNEISLTQDARYPSAKNLRIFICYLVDFSVFLSMGAKQLKYSIKVQWEENKVKYVQRFYDFSIVAVGGVQR